MFLDILPLGKADRYGLRRPDVDLRLMDPFLLHTPDFYTSSGWLVEVMGVGADATIKLKESKYRALLDWNKHQRVAFFVWDSSQNRWLLTPLSNVKTVVARVRRRGETTAFENDGNVYHPISWDELAETPGTRVEHAQAA